MVSFTFVLEFWCVLWCGDQHWWHYCIIVGVEDSLALSACVRALAFSCFHSVNPREVGLVWHSVCAAFLVRISGDFRERWVGEEATGVWCNLEVARVSGVCGGGEEGCVRRG